MSDSSPLNHPENQERVLVTGAGGYLGAVLVPLLLESGYQVTAVDTYYFGTEVLKPVIDHPALDVVHADVRDLDHSLVDGADAVIALAALSNDPAGDLDPDWTEAVNRDAVIELAEAAKERGVGRFLFASSCSVYGPSGDERRTEDDAVSPLTVYARTKLETEKALLALATDTFHTVSLRKATLFGLSPRMRFDLVANIMTMSGATNGYVQVHGDGEQWRPLLHVADAASAYLLCLRLPRERIGGGRIFNVAGSNYRVSEIAQQVIDAFDDVELRVIPDQIDRRSYQVSGERFEQATGFSPLCTVRDGIIEIQKALADGMFPDAGDSRYHTVAALRELLAKPALHGGEPVRRSFLPLALPDLGKAEEDEVLDTLRSGWLTTGPKTKRFEELCASYLGVKHAVALNSCTGALHVGLAAAGVGPGDEVITTPVSWPATANVVIHLGATPVFVDIEPDTLNIDVSLIEAAITPRTKVILPVHMAGQPCDMRAINDIAKRHGLTVIEDAAHALGAEYQGVKVGKLSTAAAFSFYPTKNMTTIEGGLLVTDDDELAERARVLSLHGITKDAWKRHARDGSPHWQLVEPGYKYNMTDVQASVGLHQLPKLEEFIAIRERYTRRYNEAFADLTCLRPLATRPGTHHVHHLYVLELRTDLLTITRDEFMAALKAEGIGTGVHFVSMHLQPYYREELRVHPDDLPVARDMSERIVSLPLFPKMTPADVESVITAVRKTALATQR
ncbi:bifunctional SDR family oxidoreductase/aminotransferase class I/II-fold pyridoxal phosphate-dependent enzyme [Streptomyces sp. PmtG]